MHKIIVKLKKKNSNCYCNKTYEISSSLAFAVGLKKTRIYKN